jgi:hypothetical protein
MTKGTMPDEISILRFFEDGPIEKAEVLFNIVRAKMLDRLSGRGEDGGESALTPTPRKRSPRPNADAPREVPETKS